MEQRIILPEGQIRGKHKFRDGLTFDGNLAYRTIDATGNQFGAKLPFAVKTFDSVTGTYSKTVDSTGAFLVGELERLDLTMHEPLAEVSWSRDLDLREDVTIADEVSSFTLSTFASAGGLGAGNSIGNGKSWIGKNTDQIPGQAIDISKIPHSLYLWGQEIKYSIPELESAARLGRPVDQQKFEAMTLKHQMDIDEMVYYGDSSLGVTGLVNNSLVTQVANLPNGVSGSPNWAKKTPDEILADVNLMLTTTWANSAWAVISDRLMLPPEVFGLISTMKVSNAGNISVLKYIAENNLLTTSQGKKLEILPLKWCRGAGAGGTIGDNTTVNRAVLYKKDYKRIRYPMTLLQRTPIQFDALWHKTVYFCRLGVLEVVYPECVSYWDGI